MTALMWHPISRVKGENYSMARGEGQANWHLLDRFIEAKRILQVT